MYQNEVDKVCFEHDIAYGDFKDLNKRTATDDKVLRDKAFNIAKNTKYDGYQCRLASMVYKFLLNKLLVEPLRLQINLQLKMKLILIKNYQKNYANQLFKNII